MASTFLLKLISPDGIKYESQAEEVILPALDGEIVVLPDHQPLVSVLNAGEIIIKNAGKIHHLVTEGGVVEIDSNTVKVLADTAEDVESLDELKIQEAKTAAEERLKNAADTEDFAEAQAQIAKQLSKLKILSKRKRKI